jgi:predicted nuclease with TOPRIM domain
MTEDQKKTLAVFESKVQQLMLLCDHLKSENEDLNKQIVVQKSELQSAQDKIRELTARYDNLKIAGMISFRQGEIKGAKQKLSKLVREVDKCIAMLNE